MIWDIAAYIGNIGTVRTFYTVLQNPVLYGTWELEPYGGIRCTICNYQMSSLNLSDLMFTNRVVRLQSRCHLVNNNNPLKFQTALKFCESGLVTTSKSVHKSEQAASTTSRQNRRNS